MKKSWPGIKLSTSLYFKQLLYILPISHNVHRLVVHVREHCLIVLIWLLRINNFTNSYLKKDNLSYIECIYKMKSLKML